MKIIFYYSIIFQISARQRRVWKISLKHSQQFLMKKGINILLLSLLHKYSIYLPEHGIRLRSTFCPCGIMGNLFHI